MTTHEASQPRWPAVTLRVLRGALVVLSLAVAGYVGGVATTNLTPVRVHTPYYSASVQLRLAPTSTIELPTVLGDVDLRFAGPIPAPGIVVNTQLRKGVTEVFAKGTPTIASLRPTPAQLDRVTHDALAGLALRFLVGVVLGIAAAAVILRLWRRGTLRTSGFLAGATTLAIVLPTVSAWQAYRVDRVHGISTTSLLGMVQANGDILGDLQQRSAESSRYVESALGIADALQQKFVPQEPAGPTALRVVFVSDIHGVNQYALLRTIIQQQHVDAVVDSGDLINFGSTQEASAAGIFAGIQSLGVPYLFARGNHDASSATDETLLKRLALVPNVRLLEPSNGVYQEISMAGVTIGGFNDYRYYGDGDPKKLSLDPRKAFKRAYADTDIPQVVVSHEGPEVADLDESSLLVSGHTHIPALDKNHLTVGTFTGGGLFGAKIAEGAESGTEVQTQDYSFDIAEWDTTCSLVTVRRFTFRDIVQGHPSLDSASILNGRQIVPPVTDRTCGGSTQPAVTTLTDPQAIAP